MSEQVKGTIELLQAQIQRQEQEIAEKKRVINSLCPLAGISPIYADVEAASSVSGTIRSDEFYGQPLQSVVRIILEKRKRSNGGAATVQEIYEAMKAGGYQFSAKNDDYAKRGLYQSLTKNSAVFHKLPNGRYGLLAWYPNAKTAKGKDDESASAEDAIADDEAVAESEAPNVEPSVDAGEAVAAGAGEAESKQKPTKPR